MKKSTEELRTGSWSEIHPKIQKAIFLPDYINLNMIGRIKIIKNMLGHQRGFGEIKISDRQTPLRLIKGNIIPRY